MSDKVHKATHASTLEIAGIKLRCYITEDGKRIIDCDDMHDFFAALESGADILPEDALNLAELVKGSKVMTEVKNDQPPTV